MAALALALAAAAPAAADPAGKTTLERRIGLTTAGGLHVPAPAPGGPPVVRAAPGTSARAGRAHKRRSLAFFAQLTDAQLADEMSPARLEFMRSPRHLGLWRPHEALGPQTFD